MSPRGQKTGWPSQRSRWKKKPREQDEAPLPSGSIACVFFDYPQGPLRHVVLDCAPELWTRLEGQTRRTWARRGLDAHGLVMYVERPPEVYRYPVSISAKKTTKDDAGISEW